MLYITKRNSRYTLQWVKVRKIGNSRHTDDRHIDHPNFLRSVKTLGKAVLILHLNIKIWCNSHHRDPALALKHLHTRIKNGLVSAEFVDDQSLDHISFIFLKKLHRSIKLCKYTSTVDISDQKHRCLCHLCHSHIDDIFFFEVDLSRAARSFYHNNIILGSKCIECLHNVRNQFFLVGKIVPCTHCAKNFTIYNNLRSHVIRRLEKNRIHKNRRFDSCCFCLHDLCPSHFQSFFCNKRIQCHIL